VPGRLRLLSDAADTAGLLPRLRPLTVLAGVADTEGFFVGSGKTRVLRRRYRERRH
jgi:hypothetical protein